MKCFEGKDNKLKWTKGKDAEVGKKTRRGQAKQHVPRMEREGDDFGGKMLDYGEILSLEIYQW